MSDEAPTTDQTINMKTSIWNLATRMDAAEKDAKVLREYTHNKLKDITNPSDNLTYTANRVTGLEEAWGKCVERMDTLEGKLNIIMKNTPVPVIVKKESEELFRENVELEKKNKEQAKQIKELKENGNYLGKQLNRFHELEVDWATTNRILKADIELFKQEIARLNKLLSPPTLYPQENLNKFVKDSDGHLKSDYYDHQGAERQADNMRKRADELAHEFRNKEHIGEPFPVTCDTKEVTKDE